MVRGMLWHLMALGHIIVQRRVAGSLSREPKCSDVVTSHISPRSVRPAADKNANCRREDEKAFFLVRIFFKLFCSSLMKDLCSRTISYFYRIQSQSTDQLTTTLSHPPSPRLSPPAFINKMLSSFAKTLAARSSSSFSRTSSLATTPMRAAACHHHPPQQQLYSTTPVQMNIPLPSSVVVLEYKYGPHFWLHREQHHQGHLVLAQQMITMGKCIAGGPIAPHSTHSFDGSLMYGTSFSEEPTGAFFWFTSLDAAQGPLRSGQSRYGPFHLRLDCGRFKINKKKPQYYTFARVKGMHTERDWMTGLGSKQRVCVKTLFYKCCLQ